MNCYVQYDKNEKIADIISIPNYTFKEIEQKQQEFFKWLFDKNNNHKYWKKINGVKSYCDYDVDAFIEWLNNNIFCNSFNKAQVLGKDAEIKNAKYNFYIFLIHKLLNYWSLKAERT